MPNRRLSRFSGPLWITALAVSALTLPLALHQPEATTSSRNTFTVDELLNTPPSDPCQFFGGENEMVEWFIKMDLEGKLIPMRVPTIFLEDKSDHEEGVHHEEQHFTFMIDNFLPVTLQQMVVILRAQRDNIYELKYAAFLVGDHIELPDIISLMISRMGGRFDEMMPMEEFPTTQGPYGLTKVVPPEGNLDSNVYFALDAGGAPTTAITCYTQASLAYPNCNMHFRASGLDVKVEDFKEFFLPRWASIKHDVERFLSCATVFE